MTSQKGTSIFYQFRLERDKEHDMTLVCFSILCIAHYKEKRSVLLCRVTQNLFTQLHPSSDHVTLLNLLYLVFFSFKAPSQKVLLKDYALSGIFYSSSVSFIYPLPSTIPTTVQVQALLITQQVVSFLHQSD